MYTHIYIYIIQHTRWLGASEEEEEEKGEEEKEGGGGEGSRGLRGEDEGMRARERIGGGGCV